MKFDLNIDATRFAFKHTMEGDVLIDIKNQSSEKP